MTTTQTTPTPGEYTVGPSRAITIFGGYPVREILDPQGKAVCAVAFFDTSNGLPSGPIPELDALLAHLNRTGQ